MSHFAIVRAYDMHIYCVRPSNFPTITSDFPTIICQLLRTACCGNVASHGFLSDAFDLRTPGGSVPPGPYFPGVDGLNALAFSNPPLGAFAQLNNSPAVSGRLDFALPFTPGLAWSVSAYFAPNIEPRGAHGDLGNLLGQTSMGC